MANTWLSLNKRRIDKVLYDIETLKLRGFDESINLDEIKNLFNMMQNEITNISKDLTLAQEENEKLLELFKDDSQ